MDAEIEEIRQTVENIWEHIRQHEAPVKYGNLLRDIIFITQIAEAIVRLSKPVAEKTLEKRFQEWGEAHGIALILLRRLEDLSKTLRLAEIKGKDIDGRSE